MTIYLISNGWGTIEPQRGYFETEAEANNYVETLNGHYDTIYQAHLATLECSENSLDDVNDAYEALGLDSLVIEEIDVPTLSQWLASRGMSLYVVTPVDSAQTA